MYSVVFNRVNAIARDRELFKFGNAFCANREKIFTVCAVTPCHTEFNYTRRMRLIRFSAGVDAVFFRVPLSHAEREERCHQLDGNLSS